MPGFKAGRETDSLGKVLEGFSFASHQRLAINADRVGGVARVGRVSPAGGKGGCFLILLAGNGVCLLP